MASLIYIGNLPSMDTNERNYTNDNPSAVYGTYSSSDMQVVDVSMSDDYFSGVTYDNDWGLPADTFTYDAGAGSVTSSLDAQARFRADVMSGDGSTTCTTISIYQLENGDTFARLPNGMRVQEITVSSMVGDGYSYITTGASSSSIVVCFEGETGILTPEGERPAQELCVGDLVETLVHGPQPIVWHYQSDHIAKGRSAPVIVSPGALGDGCPAQTLIVSPQHRLLVRSERAKALFGHHEVLVAAKKLVGLAGITRLSNELPIRYVHFCTAHHEIVTANGAAAETFLPGPIGLATLPPLAKEGLLALMNDGAVGTEPARPVPPGKLVNRLISEVKRRGEALFEAVSAPISP